MDRPSGTFSTLHTLLRYELWKKCSTSQGVSASSSHTLPFCSAGAQDSHTPGLCVTSYNSKAWIRSQPWQRVMSMGGGYDKTLALTSGRVVVGRWKMKTPAGNYKMVISKWYKKVSKHFKNFKNFQAWRTQGAGSPNPWRAALHFRGLSWRSGTWPLPL